MTYVRIALASILMGGIAWLVFRATAAIFPEDIQYQHFRLGLSILAGFVSLFPLYRIFRIPEAGEMSRIAGMLLRKIR